MVDIKRRRSDGDQKEEYYHGVVRQVLQYLSDHPVQFMQSERGQLQSVPTCITEDTSICGITMIRYEICRLERSAIEATDDRRWRPIQNTNLQITTWMPSEN